MKYVTVMQGTTGEYRTEYDSLKEAQAKAQSIRNLGYDCTVEFYVPEGASDQQKRFGGNTFASCSTYNRYDLWY